MADNKFLNLNGLQYYARKLDAKKADIESPNFLGTPTINNSPVLTNGSLVRIIDSSKLLLDEYLTNEEKKGQSYHKKYYTITDENVINDACDCFKNDSNLIEICNSLNIYLKNPGSSLPSGSQALFKANNISAYEDGHIQLTFYDISDMCSQDTYYVYLYLNETKSSIIKIKIIQRIFSDDLYTIVNNSKKYFINLDSLILTEGIVETKVENIHDFLSYSTNDLNQIKNAVSSHSEFSLFNNDTRLPTLREMYNVYYSNMPFIVINKSTTRATSMKYINSALYITFSSKIITPNENEISYNDQDAILIFTQGEGGVVNSITLNIDKYTDLTNIRLENVAKNKADLASPIFTGEPTAPTPDVDDDSTRIATTEWVKDIVPEDVSEVGTKLTKLENRLFDRVLESEEPTITSTQTNAGISPNCTYGSGSYYTDHTLKRYSVSAGDRIKIFGTAQPAKENYYIWATFTTAAFGSDQRRGAICSKDAELEIDTTITIDSNEKYLFVTISGDITVLKIGEMVEGELTKINEGLNSLESSANKTNTYIKDHFGSYPRMSQAAYESFKFLDRCKDVICAPIGQKKQTHMVYCIPDLHKDFECLESHLPLFANSYEGTYPSQSGCYSLDGMCKVIVTAGDLLFSGNNTVTTREAVLAELERFNLACKPFISYNTYIFPAIGGHDFNDYSSAMAGHDTKKVSENLTKRDQYDYIIKPALALVISAVTKITPTVPNISTDNVNAPCYYAIKDNSTGSYYVMLDECDHNNMITGTYNGNTVKWKMTKVNWTNNTFDAIDEDTNTTYTNVPMGDFEYVYSRYQTVTYSNEQLNWVANLMKNAPSGTHFWFFNHTGLRTELTDNSGGRAAIKRMIDAYINKTTYSENGNSASGDLPWSVDVDFSSCDGTVIGLFRGHGHDCVSYDLGLFKEYMSDTPGNYSSTVKSPQVFSDKFSGDLFVYKDNENKLYRLHHGRRRAGIDDVPTLEERIAALEARL